MFWGRTCLVTDTYTHCKFRLTGSGRMVAHLARCLSFMLLQIAIRKSHWRRRGGQLLRAFSISSMAKRLARELGEMLENTREIQARATFARRVDPAGRDVEDESVDGAEESEMVAYLDHLRREVGIK